MNDQINGPLRAIVPVLITYLVARGYLPEALSGPLTDLAIIGVPTLAAAAWSWVSNRRSAKVASVAAMPGTYVSPDGNTIHIVEPGLITAARDAATTPTSAARQ